MTVRHIFSSIFVKVEIEGLKRFGACHRNSALYGAIVRIKAQPAITEKDIPKQILKKIPSDINIRSKMKFKWIFQY